MNAREKQLLKTRKICIKVIQECEAKFPMSKMTYPEAVITNIEGYPYYKETIKQCLETLKNIEKVRWKE
jgi:hypothetical protein